MRKPREIKGGKREIDLVFAALVLLSLLVGFFRSSTPDREPGTGYCKPQTKIQNPTLQFDPD